MSIPEAVRAPVKPLLYGKIAALSKQRHQDLYLDTAVGYAFAQHTNSVPIGAAEFKAVAVEYPIVFLAEGDENVPVAVVGLEPKNNAFVSTEGKWLGRYVPAYIRRYPFISVQTSADNLALCIDEDAQCVNRNEQGYALFDKGEVTSLLEEKKQFAHAYEIEIARNRNLSGYLHAFDLLEPTHLVDSSEQKGVISGFYVVSKQKLSALSEEQLKKLQDVGALELIYQHLFSLDRFADLARAQSLKPSSENGEI